MSTILQGVREWVVVQAPNALRIVGILIGALVLVRVGRKLIARLVDLAEDDDKSTTSEVEKRARTLGRIANQILWVLVWGIAVTLILGELGLNLGPILAGAGIAGLAVGFGAQTLVKDIISGFFILFENQFRVNDVIETAGVSGLVEAINLRTTVLRDVQGRVHVIPNGSITVVSNYTREWSRALLDVGVAYKEDTDRCTEILKRVGKSLEDDPHFGELLEGAFEYPGVESFADSAVLIRMMVKTRPLEQWNVMRELRRRIKHAFDEEGIEIPFPHMTVYMGDEATNQRLHILTEGAANAGTAASATGGGA